MAPKRSVEQRVRRSSIRDPEEKESNNNEEEEEFDPPLNQGGLNPTFDPVVGPPASKDISSASASAQGVAYSSISERDVFILERQAQQEVQLRQLFSLVTTLGSEIKSVVKVVASSSEQSRLDHQSNPAHKEKGKTARCNVAFEIKKDDEVDLNDDKIGNDKDGGYCADDDYVSHGCYRDLIAEGFDKRSPSRLAVKSRLISPSTTPSRGHLHPPSNLRKQWSTVLLWLTPFSRPSPRHR
jgi:hypothetical protein